MADLKITGLHKYYGQVHAVKGIDLEIPAGEFTVLVGQSGCGKSTLLRTIAGLEDADKGRIEIGGHEVTHMLPRDRDIAMVFQNYALYAHMTVRNNMAFGLKMARLPKQEIRTRVDEAAAMLGLGDLLNRKPRQLSGGQRQRVAMGRAIVREPAAFLMDEPLSNLDAKLRVEMRGEIIRVQRRISAPTLYVTHDQTEAMTMGDRVAILRDGLLQQLGTPDEVYDRPVNAFVAGFIGSPSMNLVPATLERDGDGLAVAFAGAHIPLPAEAVSGRPGLAGRAGRPVTVGLRPEDFGRPGGAEIDVEVTRLESLGSELVAYLTPAGAQDGPLLTARLDRGETLVQGETARVTVDARRLYFFDTETGDALGSGGAGG